MNEQIFFRVFITTRLGMYLALSVATLYGLFCAFSGNVPMYIVLALPVTVGFLHAVMIIYGKNNGWIIDTKAKG